MIMHLAKNAATMGQTPPATGGLGFGLGLGRTGGVAPHTGILALENYWATIVCWSLVARRMVGLFS